LGFCKDNKVSKYKFYFGKEAGEKFIDDMIVLAEYFVLTLQSNRYHFIADQIDVQNMRHFEICAICKGDLERTSVSWVNRKIHHMHHNHMSVCYENGGRLLGIAHDTCNLKDKTLSHLPVLFHNFGKYDSKIIIQALHKSIAKRV